MGCQAQREHCVVRCWQGLHACVTFVTWNSTYITDFVGSSEGLPSLQTVSLGIETLQKF